MNRVSIKRDNHPTAERKLQGKTAPESGAVNVQQALANPEIAMPGDVLALQQTAGNSAVAGWMQQSAPPAEAGRAGGALGADFSASVNQARGSGAPLPPALREEMAHSLGSEFGSVRVHTDDQADALAEGIQARAFTTGPDIFFRKGTYDPNTPGGKHVLKHELAHVMQQGGAASSHLTLGPVNDVHEQEADRLSQHPLSSQPSTTAPAGAVQRFWLPGQKRKMEKLGGSMNTVYRVKHREGNTGYLKPNSEDDPTMGARAVLSSDIDQSMGLNALSRETYQNYGNGKEGTESSEVRGDEIHTNEYNTRISKAEYKAGMYDEANKYKEKRSGPFGLRKKYYKLSATNYKRHDFADPATQKSLSNIQLEDAITGQMDRHGGNMKINPVTHEAKGYDNDLMEISRSNKLSSMAGLQKPTGVGALSAEQEATRQNKRSEALKAVNKHWGKQVGLPSHMDRAAADKLVSTKSSAFIADLQNRNSENMDRLSPGTIEELKNRYSSVRRYAKAGMASAGLVNNPAKAAKWSSPAYQDTVKKGAGMVPKIINNGGWNQNTYNEQVSKYAGKKNSDYQSYLQRGVLNYNSLINQGGTASDGDMIHRAENASAGPMPAPAMQGPPPEPAAAPPPAAAAAAPTVAPPPPTAVAPAVATASPPVPVNAMGPAQNNVAKLREIYEKLGKK